MYLTINFELWISSFAGLYCNKLSSVEFCFLPLMFHPNKTFERWFSLKPVGDSNSKKAGQVLLSFCFEPFDGQRPFPSKPTNDTAKQTPTKRLLDATIRNCG